MNAIDILKQAREAVAAGRWTQGTISDRSIFPPEDGGPPRACAIGLITEAAVGRPVYLTRPEARDAEAGEELLVAATALAEQAPEELRAMSESVSDSRRSYVEDVVMTYNDGDLGEEDVLAWFDAAIESLGGEA